MNYSRKKLRHDKNSVHIFSPYILGRAISVAFLFLLIMVFPVFVFLMTHQTEDKSQAAAATPAPMGPSGNWSMVWNDEFNDAPGMSGPVNGLAASKWNSGWQSGPVRLGVGNTHAITYPVNQSLEEQYYGPASILFPGDGAVHLRLQQGVDNNHNFGGKSIESGMLTTAGLMALNPANVPVSPSLSPYVVNGPSVLEVRMRITGPHADAGAYWPVLWMTNAGNYGNNANPPGSSWPGGSNSSEEIDNVEWYNRGALGSNGDFHLHNASEYGGMSSIPSTMQNTDMSLTYHTYTYYFTPTTIQIWVDGTSVSSVKPTTAQIQAQWQFPQYIMLAAQAYSGAMVPTTASAQPNDMMIDYVRVWKPCVINCTPTSVTPAPSSTPTSVFTGTTTPTTLNTDTFNLVLCPHGLGNCGDNVNPTSGGNSNPIHITRNVNLTILNANNQEVAHMQGTVKYNTIAKNFQGTISTPPLLNGSYVVNVKLDGFLSKQVPGIITVTSTQHTFDLPSISLTTGNVNNDTQLDLLDYNVLISCFGSRFQMPSCPVPATSQYPGADVTDDGTVDGADYNLFLRELSVQKGG